ncbi:MAG: cobalamin biosynthesis protein CbiX [Verrucomicrobia bacterium]|nr:cobalamin biosynthesis protein CbiX [Verrucomicrobiota bacterium]
MTVALIDNGSLEPAATRNLRVVAASISAATDVTVHPVSWKHSDRIPLAALDGDPAGTTVGPFVRSQLALGERHFVFVPFFISAQGAIGSALRSDLEKLRTPETPFELTFTPSLADGGVIAPIVAARVRETIALAALDHPPVIIVDHGGPSPASAALRNQIADEVCMILGSDVGPVAAASMEGGDHAHNHPLLAEQLRAPGFDAGDVVVALLFLSPGRHAGAGGDIAQICGAAETTHPALRCHLTDLVGTHPLAADTLAAALRATLSSLHAPLSA